MAHTWKLFTVRSHYYLVQAYISIMPFKRLAQLFVILGIFASGALTAAITFSTLSALFATLTATFLVLSPLMLPMNILFGISALALGVKAAYETSKFLWSKGSRWGQGIDNWLIKKLAGQPYYLETVNRLNSQCAGIILKIEPAFKLEVRQTLLP